MHGSLASVQLNVLVSHYLERIANLVGRWNTTFPAEKAPDPHERSDCQIEGALAGAAVFDAIGEETEQLPRNYDGVHGRFAVDAAPLTRRLVIREQIIEALNFVKCGASTELDPKSNRYEGWRLPRVLVDIHFQMETERAIQHEPQRTSHSLRDDARLQEPRHPGHTVWREERHRAR